MAGRYSTWRSSQSHDADEPDKRSNADWIELQSIITQLRNLPAGSRRDAEAMDERYREQKIARQRIDHLLQNSHARASRL